jgi:hypothetical protein
MSSDVAGIGVEHANRWLHLPTSRRLTQWSILRLGFLVSVRTPGSSPSDARCPYARSSVPPATYCLHHRLRDNVQFIRQARVYGSRWNRRAAGFWWREERLRVGLAVSSGTALFRRLRYIDHSVCASQASQSEHVEKGVVARQPTTIAR